jgi:repressor LexA
MHLTAVQTKMMHFIKDFITKNDVPPTRQEIAEGLGYRSPNSAEEGLKILERKGQIRIIKGTSRGIRLEAQWK